MEQKPMYIDDKFNPVDDDAPKPTKQPGVVTFVAWEGFCWMLKMVLYVSLTILCLVGLEAIRDEPTKYIAIAETLLAEFTRFMNATY